jgi:hypothetical protein
VLILLHNLVSQVFLPIIIQLVFFYVGSETYVGNL